MYRAPKTFRTPRLQAESEGAASSGFNAKDTNEAVAEAGYPAGERRPSTRPAVQSPEPTLRESAPRMQSGITVRPYAPSGANTAPDMSDSECNAEPGEGGLAQEAAFPDVVQQTPFRLGPATRGGR